MINWLFEIMLALVVICVIGFLFVFAVALFKAGISAFSDKGKEVYVLAFEPTEKTFRRLTKSETDYVLERFDEITKAIETDSEVDNG